MRKRYNIIYGLVVLGLLFVLGCSKESNIVAPSGSAIELSLEAQIVSKGYYGPVNAIVKDSNGNPMNGAAVDFTSSHPRVAGFSSTKGAVSQKRVSSDDSGIATVTFYTYSTGTATITGDIRVVSGTTTVTVE